jgi:hypothetical protein
VLPFLPEIAMTAIQPAAPKLEDLLPAAQKKVFAYFTSDAPDARVTQEFNDAVDGYMNAFKSRYKSLDAYVAEKQKDLRAFADKKVVARKGPILSLTESFTAELQSLNAKVYGDAPASARETFAEYFVLKLPGIVAMANTELAERPDLPKKRKLFSFGKK